MYLNSSDPRLDIDGDMTAPAMQEALDRLGVSAPPLAPVAERLNITVPGLLRWFGSKEAMLARVAGCFARHLAGEVHDAVARRGWAGFLPSSEEELSLVRTWFAWEAIGRTRPDVRRALATFPSDLRDLLWLSNGGAEPKHEMMPRQALLIGLWHGLAHPPGQIAGGDLGSAEVEDFGAAAQATWARVAPVDLRK